MNRRYYFWDEANKRNVNTDCIKGIQEAKNFARYLVLHFWKCKNEPDLIFAGSLPVNADGTLADTSEAEWKKVV